MKLSGTRVQCEQKRQRSMTHWVLVHTNVACAIGQSVTTSSTDFSFKTWFLEFIWILSGRNHLKINISHILNPNLLNPAHQDLSNNTKGTIQFLGNFQLQFNLIFSEEIIQYSRTFAPQVQMPWKQSLCTPPRWELSKDTKNEIWSILVQWIL